MQAYSSAGNAIAGAGLKSVQTPAWCAARKPAYTVDLFARHGLIKRLPIELASRVEPYSLVRRRGSPLSPSAAMLIEEIKRGLALDGGAFSL